MGCDAVKFQLFKIDQLFAPEILKRSEEHRRRREWELAPSFLPVIAARCRERRIKLACTPFYLDGVDELLPHVDFLKIASYELLWDDLLMACARTGKRIVLSTGMATLTEVERAVRVLCAAGCAEPTLLHCVSSYPVPPEACNLAAIRTLRDNFGCPTGWSDHSVSPGVIYRAVHRWNAAMIEFHLDLDGEGGEFSTGHCWLPEQMQVVIEEVRRGLVTDGNGEKEPSPSEESDREWRADPSDGLRPLLGKRCEWGGSR
ncbi:N-acetylneuraminate synthase family protein [Planctomycetota bacterium]